MQLQCTGVVSILLLLSPVADTAAWLCLLYALGKSTGASPCTNVRRSPIATCWVVLRGAELRRRSGELRAYLPPSKHKP